MLTYLKDSRLRPNCLVDIDILAIDRFIAKFFNKIEEKIKQFKYSNYSYPCYLRFEVKDKPGVLSGITRNLGENKISIEKLMQIPDKKKPTASINIITHETIEKRVIKCLHKLKKNKHIIKSPTFIRVGDINGN